MSCDFELQIEVFFHDQWIPVVVFGTKTRVDGFPLAAATNILRNQKEITGDYRWKELWDFEYGRYMKHLGLPADPKPKGRRQNNWYPEEFIAQWKCSLFYSQEQFEQLINCLCECKNPYAERYKILLKPVPKWMQMAKSAWPTLKVISMTEQEAGIQQITEILAQAQKKKRDHYNYLFLCFRFLPRELVRVIVKFAFPCGSDVRIAWSDNEGHSELAAVYR
jgi:hypothetical protein